MQDTQSQKNLSALGEIATHYGKVNNPISRNLA